jgi:hypothetical protein
VSPREKREVSRIVWRTAEQLKPTSPPEPAKLAAPQPNEPAPVPSDFSASDEAEKQQTEADSPPVLTIQAAPARKMAEQQADDPLN